jgi:hypothetical protein
MARSSVVATSTAASSGTSSQVGEASESTAKRLASPRLVSPCCGGSTCIDCACWSGAQLPTGPWSPPTSKQRQRQQRQCQRLVASKRWRLWLSRAGLGCRVEETQTPALSAGKVSVVVATCASKRRRSPRAASGLNKPSSAAFGVVRTGSRGRLERFGVSASKQASCVVP